MESNENHRKCKEKHRKSKGEPRKSKKTIGNERKI